MSDKPCSRENGFRVDCIKHYAEVEAENARLKAEVERLRKAGDAMADLLSCAGSPPNIVQSWNAAKEGKQS